MIFTETKIKGVYIVEPEKFTDTRGFFTRTFCKQEFEKYGLNSHLIQSSVSFNRSKATVRGMHYQEKPYQETKLVRCTRGAIYDVIADIRPGSLTFGQWLAVELDENNHKELYIPEGIAHGFQTLEDNTEVFYQISEYYVPKAARGFRWNDPAFKIELPLEVSVISNKDLNYPDFIL